MSDWELFGLVLRERGTAIDLLVLGLFVAATIWITRNKGHEQPWSSLPGFFGILAGLWLASIVVGFIMSSLFAFWLDPKSHAGSMTPIIVLGPFVILAATAWRVARIALTYRSRRDAPRSGAPLN